MKNTTDDVAMPYVYVCVCVCTIRRGYLLHIHQICICVTKRTCGLCANNIDFLFSHVTTEGIHFISHNHSANEMCMYVCVHTYVYLYGKVV